MAENVKRVSSTEAELTLKIEWHTIKAKYDEELDKICKKAQIPGFRQGKAPKNLVEKKLGEGFLDEIASNVMDEALREAVDKLDEKDKPLPYSHTTLKDEEKVFPIKKDEDLEITVKYEIMPEFEVKDYKGISVEYPNVVISDEMVEKEINNLKERNAVLRDKGDEAIAEGDIVNADYEVEGEADSKRTDYVFTVGSHTAYFDFDDEIIGAKKGEEKVITKTYDEKNKPVGYDKDNATIKVKINSVKKKELPELNDEFAEDVNEEYKTVQDLKNGIRKNLEKDLDDRLKETKISLLLDKIIPSVNLEIPTCMIDYEVANTFRRFSYQMGMKEEDTIKFLTANGQSLDAFTSAWRPDAEHTIKSQLIVTKIRDEEKITVSDDDINAEYEKQHKDDKDNPNAELYKNMIKDNLEYQKTIDFLLENNKLTASKEKVTYEDFASGKYLEEKEDKKESKEEVKSEEKKETKKTTKRASKKDKNDESEVKSE